MGYEQLNDLLAQLNANPATRLSTLNSILSLIINNSQLITQSLVKGIDRFINDPDSSVQQKTLEILNKVRESRPELLSSTTLSKINLFTRDFDRIIRSEDLGTRSSSRDSGLDIVDEEEGEKTKSFFEKTSEEEQIEPEEAPQPMAGLEPKQKREDTTSISASDARSTPSGVSSSGSGLGSSAGDIPSPKPSTPSPPSPLAPAPAPTMPDPAPQPQQAASPPSSTTSSSDFEKELQDIRSPASEKDEKSLRRKSTSKKKGKKLSRELKQKSSDISDKIVEDRISDDLFSDSDDTTVVKSQGYATVDYFDQMNPSKVYAVNVALSKSKIEIKTKQRDVLTGETKKQVQKTFEVDFTKPIEVEIDFPGCLVTPVKQKVILREDKKKVLTFFVTPLAKGRMRGQVKVIQDEQLVLSIILNFKVFDQRIASLLAKLGIAVSAVPLFVTYVLGVNPNDIIAAQLTTLGTGLTSPILLGIELLITLIFIFGAFISYRRYQGKRKSMSSNPF